MNFENLKKAITMIAVGFIFTLVDLNVTLNGRTLNITPDFIGWLLYFLAFDKLGDYGKGREYLKWAALPMMLVHIVLYAWKLINPEADLQILTTVASLCEMVYLFLLLGIVEMIAEDTGSSQTSRIHTVRIMTVAAEIFLQLLVLFTPRIGVPQAVVALVIMIVLLIVTILTLVALLKLRKELNAL